MIIYRDKATGLYYVAVNLGRGFNRRVVMGLYRATSLTHAISRMVEDNKTAFAK